jgi:hypothetical protein
MSTDAEIPPSPPAPPASEPGAPEPADRRPWDRALDFLFRPALPSESAPWWDAGGGLFTVLYWACLAVMVAALFRQKFLPLVDYPQHLFLASLLARLSRPDAPERALFDTNVASFNSMFHVLVALLARVMPIERAGEAVVGATFLGWGAAVLQLLKVTGTPRGRAFLVTVMLPTSTLAWGFCNFQLSLCIQLFVLARVLGRRRVLPDERLRYDAITALLALLGMWAHLLASLLAYALMLAVLFGDAQSTRRRSSLLRRLGYAVRAGLPLLPAVGYAYWSYRRQPMMASQPVDIGAKDHDVYVLQKIGTYITNLTSFRADLVDSYVAGVATALLGLSGLLTDRSRTVAPGARLLFPAACLLYLVLPMEMWGTWYIFPRAAVVVAAAALLYVPWPAPRVQARFSAIFCGVALFTAGWFFVALGNGRSDYDDLDALIDDAPPGLRVTGLIYDMSLPGYRLSPLCHAAAYYTARRGGELAFSFTRTASLPVHYKPGKTPPGVPGHFEWEPDKYKPGSTYAVYFDTVLVRTKEKDAGDPRQKIFGSKASSIKVLSHHGRWWMLATRP